MDIEMLQIVAQIIGLVLAIVLHEVAHGWAALWLGDPTAQLAGRLSLNPIKHVDPVGTILVPLVLLLLPGGFLFGWAKPVPVNYYNLRKGKYGPVLVALAGPATNFMLLAVFATATRFVSDTTSFGVLFLTIALVNGFLMMFNLLPIPPLDGSKVLYLFLEDRPDVIRFMEQYGMMLLFAIIVLGGGFLSAWVAGPAFGLTVFFSGVPF